MKRYALIVAGGQGLRMGAPVPKQFLPVAGKPVLMHTLEAFYKTDPAIELILVLPLDQQAYWKTLCQEYRFERPHRIADGGSVRFESVQNGLKLIDQEGLVAVHDGVRPLVTTDLILRCYETAGQTGSALPVFELTESLRRIDGETSFAEDRSRFRSVQTPQTFRSGVLIEAYQQTCRADFTDDASVVEAAGYRVTLVEGFRENIKITNPLDLILAEHLLKERA